MPRGTVAACGRAGTPHGRAPDPGRDRRAGDRELRAPLGQDVQVRVVDAEGRSVPGAALRVRYHEPEKPIRRVAFETDDLTDGDGRMMLRDVGIEVPFVVDVLAPHHPPVSSERTRLAAGETEIEDIVLGERGATVVVGLVDKAGNPVSGARVMLLADRRDWRIMRGAPGCITGPSGSGR